LAQTEPEEIKLNSDQFRYFYESLKQKQLKTTINQSLEECLKIEADNATIHFELGKITWP
jgi:hypothetical protein